MKVSFQPWIHPLRPQIRGANVDYALQSACRSISDMVSKAGVQDLTGLAGTGENIQVANLPPVHLRLALRQAPCMHTFNNTSITAGRGTEETRHSQQRRVQGQADQDGLHGRAL